MRIAQEWRMAIARKRLNPPPILPPPTGQRFLRVLRTIRHSEPITHPTNPTLDSWSSWEETKVKWIPLDEITRDDVRLDL